MKLYICNAFALSMLDRAEQCQMPRQPTPISVEIARQVAQAEEFISAVGHTDAAQLFSTELGVDIAPNRVSIKLQGGDMLLVGQYIGPRLPEGTTALPPDATIEWWLI